MSMDINSIGTLLSSATTKASSRLEATLTEIAGSEDLSPAMLIEMQTDVTSWTLATQVNSTVIKTIGDSAKEVVQKSG